MAVRRPTLEQLRAVAEDLGMTMGDEELKSYDALMQANYLAYDAVDAMADYVPPVKYPRTPGYRPEGEENKYNAWYVKTEIKGAPSGKLAGKKIALKDNVSLAGVPMMNGASTLEGYTPDIDATIVTRILDAGGTIVGKTHCEYFCFSGGSHTCAAGAVHNPHKMGYSSGGSSSGSAVVVATGEVDMAIGGDQGGSIRIPSAFSGIYGMKGTFGLVPYTGVMPIEITIDHTGPMTRNVRDNALLLEVLAGADGLDPRQGDAEGVELHRSARRRRQGIAHRHRQGRFWASELGGRRRRQGQGRSRSVPEARRHRRRDLGADASGRARDLAADRRRRRHRVHDEGQRHGDQLARSLQYHAARRPFGLEAPRGRIVRQPQDHDAARAIFHQALSRPFLRQGAEPEPQAARRLRRGAGQLRSAADADVADEGDAAAAAGCAA